MLLREPTFFKEDGGAPLLMQNHKYLEKHSDIAWKKTRIWTKYLLNKNDQATSLDDEKKTYQLNNGIKPLNNNINANNINNNSDKKLLNYGLIVIKKPDRIIVKDADRTFCSDSKKQLLITLLTSLQTLFNDYQQTMSYVSGILLLFHPVDVVFDMMFTLGRSPTYNMSGYWRAEAVQQGIDAYVLYEIIKKINPQLYSHLNTIGVLPDTFVQKWFGGLAVQVMPIQHLIDFWTQFFKYGFRYLFKFIISLLETLSPQLLSINTDYKLYEVLRVDRKTHFWECVSNNSNNNSLSPNKNLDIDKKISLFFTKVLSNANSIGTLYNFDKIDFQKEREYAFNQYLLKRFLNAAQKVTFKGFQVESDDGDDDEFNDCEQCDDGFADFYCEVCKIYLCDECHENPSGDHALNHAIQQLAITDNDDTLNID